MATAKKAAPKKAAPKESSPERRQPRRRHLQRKQPRRRHCTCEKGRRSCETKEPASLRQSQQRTKLENTGAKKAAPKAAAAQLKKLRNKEKVKAFLYKKRQCPYRHCLFYCFPVDL